MGRLIDADALIKHLTDWRLQECPVGVCDEETETYKTICECIETDMEQHDKVIYEQGYNKAIDEFEKEIVAEYDNDACPGVTDYLDYTISIRDLFKIVEQLKGGVT